MYLAVNTIANIFINICLSVVLHIIAIALTFMDLCLKLHRNGSCFYLLVKWEIFICISNGFGFNDNGKNGRCACLDVVGKQLEL